MIIRTASASFSLVMDTYKQSMEKIFTAFIVLCLIYDSLAFQPVGYQGCYFHIFYTPALGIQFATNESNTGDVCKRICKSKSYKFAAVRSGECYCGNEVRTAKYTSGCDITCPGRGTEKCGGLFRVSVYDVEADEISTSSVVTTETSGANTSTSTFVTDTSHSEDNSSPAVTLILVVAILSILAVSAFIVVRKCRRLGITYTVSGNKLFKRYFDSPNENYERHIDTHSRFPDRMVPAVTDSDIQDAEVNVQVCSLYATVNKQHTPVNKQVYNHINNYRKPAVDKTYSPLSTVEGDIKANKIIDTYSHLSTQVAKETVDDNGIERDQTYNNLKAVSGSSEDDKFNDDISTMYDRTHVFNHDALIDQADEYFHTNNGDLRSMVSSEW